jgi:hypothetical protein
MFSWKTKTWAGSGLRAKLGAAGVILLTIAGCFLADDSLAGSDQATGLSLHANFPAKRLRGYGTVSAKEYVDVAGGSILRIEAQDGEHARLLQAKYLSDLGELPPGTTPGQIDVGGAKISIQIADNVGAVAALRQGTTVVIAATKTPEALSQLIAEGIHGDLGAWTSIAEGKVPMYLDRFDKYGFRFYYAPGQLKPGPNGQDDPTYDPQEDFAFAKKTQGGILIWNGAQWGETAVGLTRRPSWNWALGEAKKNGLAFGINTGIEGNAYWYFNRHPESMMQFAPDFLGTYYGSMNFGIPPMISWSNPAGQDAMLQQLQGDIRDLKDTDNITSWLEPHEELGGGIADILVDFGPEANADFQKYLRDKYNSLSAVSQRWYGNANGIAAWKDIEVPETASFLGWGPDALDLAGMWKVNYEAADNPAALAADFDDSTWGQMQGPGDGLARLLPPKPDIWRRHMQVDGAWLAKNPKVWLYVFDLNDTRGADTDSSKAFVVSLNGTKVPENPPFYDQDHWAALDVTGNLHVGDNVLAFRLPRGCFNYRVYLSGSEPKSYPTLGEGKNAQWTDFTNWVSYIRKEGVRRGMQMIRQADPDRGIMLMAPDSYEDDIFQNAIEYGGDFHNTGYMAGWWSDREPALMRSMNLPFSAEPGGGPTKPSDVLGEFGNWITLGVNGIDHFQNLGEVLWNPPVKQCFEDHAAMYTSVGRYHVPVAQIAAIYSNHINNLFGFPWAGHIPSDDGQPYFRGGGNPSGFDCRTFFSPTENIPATDAIYESDAVKEQSFVHNQVGKYRVVIDTDTAILDADTIDGIERYVRGGGIFVTFGETGRHSPEKPDSWPMDRLTGFHIASPKPDNGNIAPAPAQTLFPADWKIPGNVYGFRLKAIAPDAQTIMTWNDGQTAVGLRKLGKGCIITLGPLFYRVEGTDFFAHLLKWIKLDPIPARFVEASVSEANDHVFWRHFLSNNGLYDVWVVRNNRTDPASGTLVLADGLRPPWAVDLNSGQRAQVTDGRIPVTVAPQDMVMLITPRNDVARGPAEWFDLQRGWWQGTGDQGKPFAAQKEKLTVDLTKDWLFKAVDPAQKDVSALLDPKADDSSWEKMPLGIFTLPDHPDVRHLVVRKHFHIPAEWNHGRTLIRVPDDQSYWENYIDGKAYNSWSDPDPVFAAGSDHVLAVECLSQGTLIGAQSSIWLTYHPDPAAKQDLSGKWETSADVLKWDGTVTLPGQPAQEVKTLRTTFQLDPKAAGKTVVVHAMEHGRGLRGVVINGQYVLPYVREGSELNLNITPWVKSRQENDLVLIGGGGETINEVSLEFHIPGTYP